MATSARLLAVMGCLTMGLAAASSRVGKNGSPLTVVYAWEGLDFVFPSNAQRASAIRKGYDPKATKPFGMEVWEKAGRRKEFVSIPDVSHGVPATLATVSQSSPDKRSPQLTAYPSWQWHRGTSCEDNLFSVYRVAVDELDRLWVLDNGQRGKCPAKLLTFDLNTDKLLARYEFPDYVLQPASILVNVIADVRKDLDGGFNTYVYVADWAGAVIVHDYQVKSSWRAESAKLRADPGLRPLPPADGGSLSLALTPVRCGLTGLLYCEDRLLHFHATPSVAQNFIRTSYLRYSDMFKDQANQARHVVDWAFTTYNHTRLAALPTDEAIDEHGVMFLGLPQTSSLACWYARRQRDLLPADIKQVASDPERLQRVLSITARHGTLRVLSRSKTRAGRVTHTLQTASVSALTRGTACDPGKYADARNQGRGVLEEQPLIFDLAS